MPKGGSKPGERRGGRQKGTPNKVTASIKEALQAAFDEVGGKDYLVKVATTDPKAFCTLIGKVIPQDVNQKLEATVTHHDGVDRPPRESREEWLERKRREFSMVAPAGTAD